MEECGAIMSDDWLISLGSEIGSSHVDRNEPKQDSGISRRTENGWAVFCLSDGAGSSKNSAKSSDFTSKFMTTELLQLAQNLDELGPGSWINDFIIQSIINLRKELRRRFETDDLSDYHCTLVAGLIGHGVGLAVHIGDGIIIGGKTNEPEPGSVTLNSDVTISWPENGEYANETYFLTESRWLHHLRIANLGNIDWLLAATDGGQDVISAKGDLDEDYIVKIFGEALINQGCETFLSDILSGENADLKTHDDKTLLIAFKAGLSGADEITWAREARSLKKKWPVNQPEKTLPASGLSDPTTPKKKIFNSLFFKNIFGFWRQSLMYSIALVLVIFVIMIIILKFDSSVNFLNAKFESFFLQEVLPSDPPASSELKVSEPGVILEDKLEDGVSLAPSSGPNEQGPDKKLLGLGENSKSAQEQFKKSIAD